jgi:predicted CopG family antitoxin
MNKELFDQAVRINQSIEHYEKMKLTLKNTYESLCHVKSADDAEKLSRLILELMEKPKGGSILFMFVAHFTLEIDGFINDLRKEFNEL